MGKFIVDFWLDGYDSEEEAEDAGLAFMEEELNMTASYAKIVKFEDSEVGELVDAMENLVLSIATPDHNQDTATLMHEDIMRCKELVSKYKEEG